MLSRLAQPFVRLFARWMPNPFIFAALLSLLTFVLAVVVADYPAARTVDAWGSNFWRLLTFSGQIAMTLITGYALAHTPIVRRALMAFANLAHTPAAAYVIVGLAAGVGSLISWSIGLIVGAIIARQTAAVCRAKNIIIHYPLMVATAYSGFVIWHMGLSSSVGLVIATEGHFLADAMGVVPVSQTILAPWNIATALTVLLTMPFVMMMLKPAKTECIPIPDALVDMSEDSGDDDNAGALTPAARMENARIINLLIGAGGLLFLYFHFVSRSDGLDLNVVNFMFLIGGILLTRSPLHYARLITDGGRTLGPILLQYPFYAGIMGMMLDSGLATMIAGGFVAIASADTLPFWSMISGGLLNIFIPSGGGQWAVQGPIMIEAARELGADMPRVAMGVALGDGWTNMIQPFWTIPALAIAGLHVRDIMGYCVIALIWSGLIFSAGLLLL